MLNQLVFVLILTCASCASQSLQLSEKAREIEVVVHGPGCPVVQKLIGRHAQGSKELALNDALNQAGKLNATHLQVNQEVPNGRLMQVYATAFKCD